MDWVPGFLGGLRSLHSPLKGLSDKSAQIVVRTWPIPHLLRCRVVQVMLANFDLFPPMPPRLGQLLRRFRRRRKPDSVRVPGPCKV